MATEPTEKKPRKRARRNYAKEMERIATYLDLIIRVKQGVHDELPTDQVDARSRVEVQIWAYSDIKKYMEGK